jgi:SagB-type dehydrogenase family enzyme
MSDPDPPFAERAPFAWSFHRASARWPFNMLGTDVDETPEPGREIPGARFVPLPPPELPAIGLEAAMSRRASGRDFGPEPLGLGALGTLLHWASGITAPGAGGGLDQARRPAPSAGSMYALELYVIARNVEGLAPAIYHFQPVGHGLEEVRDTVPARAHSTYLFMGQPYVTAAAATIVFTAVFGRALKKYEDRGYRYLLIEAGHAAQNAMLAGIPLGLGTCGIGGFFDIELAGLLDLDVARELPLYAIACGPLR